MRFAVSLAIVLYELVLSSYSVFAPWRRAIEHKAIMKVVEMSPKILDSAHRLLRSATFEVTFIPVLLSLLVIAYCADMFCLRFSCLTVGGHRRHLSVA
jgi:hypothetical protein